MFRLKCHQNYDVSHVNTWVAASLGYRVQELELFIRTKEGTNNVLPRDLFACETLVVLKLGTCFVMNVPTSVRMQSLKILHLHFVKLEDDNSIYRLIHGCPLLDELSMVECVGKDVRIIHIFAPVLTKLSIKHYDHGTYEIVLDTPGLLYLELDDNVKSVQGYLVKNLYDLIKVQINVGGPFGLESHEIISKAVTDLLMGISRVQHLVLQWRFIEVLHKCNYRLPSMFHNLTSLELDPTDYLAWELMLLLLEKSPRLETLVFSDVPPCLVTHLKVIEIVGFQGFKEELKLFKYFLKNGVVLEKLRIVVGFDDLDYAKELEVVTKQKLLRLPRGSTI
ncbi:hypothetical protein RHGRI_033861 [Rhododendron griersonianum]|uniref:FBD domain-containing protein n=1 Tax=Rhododendron griersonianum TaxID=479676 RepID=A0AAV6HZ91_9ERIC|nr:hypothetical protein RHGRI_033861 [Rhododendron griersonianum]